MVVFGIINIMAIFQKITWVTDEQSKILKERFNLSEGNIIISTIIPNHFFRPTLKVLYYDDGLIKIVDSGKIGESNDSAFSIFSDLMKQNIFNYLYIVDILFIISLIILIIYKRKSYKSLIDKSR